ncbi:MAG: hypothetical protein ACLQVF_25135 [Isosphaeraceae bacterium]
MDISRQRLAEFLAARLRATRTDKKERQDLAQDAHPLGIVRPEEKAVASPE